MNKLILLGLLTVILSVIDVRNFCISVTLEPSEISFSRILMDITLSQHKVSPEREKLSSSSKTSSTESNPTKIS